MQIKTLCVGALEENCYIVINESTLECVVIDPGDESNTILNYMEENHLHCSAILLTHGHFDHTGAVEAVSTETGAEVWMNERDDAKNGISMHLSYQLPASGHYIREGDVISVAGLNFTVLSTPGHTPGSVCFICEDAIFTGDTLFRGSCGRTDFEGGSPKDMLESLKRLCELGGNYDVYPGHMDSSSLQRERMFNYYCRLAVSGNEF